jgi:DNA polymerase elongation subunit (family B)
MATVANAADAAAWPHGAWPHGCVVPFGTPLRDTEFFRAAVGIGASTGSAPAPLDADTDDLVFRAESITAPLPHDPECLLRVFGVDVHGRTVTLKVTDTPYCVDLNVGDAEPATPDQIRDVVDCIHDKVRTAMAKAQTKVASARKKLQTARTPQQVADAEEQMKILHNITSTAIVLSHEKHVGKLSHGHQFPHLRVLDAEYQRKHTLARDADPAHRYTLRRFPDDPTDLGFRHGKSGFVRLRCQSAVMARVITECIKREDTSLHGYLKRPQRVYGHDSKIKIESRFWFSNERQLCGWLRVATGAWQRLPDGVCRDDIGAVARDCDIVGVPERSSDDAPYRIMQYDLETRCPSQQFPNPDRPEDGIDQDGITVFHSTNITKPAAKCVIVVWNGTLTSAGAVADMKDHNGNGFDLEDPVDDLTFFQVPTERDLLLLHREMVLAINPRRICGWNTSTFDDRYLGRRAERLCGKAWFDQSPWVGEHFELEKRVLESKQKGKREFETYTIPGRVNLDVMLFCKDIGSKMPSYKLENVSAALLGRHKVELGSPAKINQLMMLRHTSEVDFEFSRSPPPLDPALLDALKRRDTVKTTDELVDAMARRCGLDWMSTWIQRISHTSQPKPRIIDRPGCVSEQARRFARQLLDSIETAKQTPNARMLALVHEGLDQMCHELPKHYAARFTMTPSQAMAFIAVYCASDTLRPQEIADVRDMFGTVEELAGVGGVNMEDLLYRGQSVRTMNFIAQECYAKSHCVPFIPRPPRDFVPPGYQGAAVIDAMVGIHEDPIITLDFASLYPSIIKSHNLSWDTMVSSHTDNTEGCLCGTQWVCGCGTWNRNLVPDNPSPERQARVDAYEHGKSTHCQECGAARPPLVLATPPPQYTCPPPDDGKPYNAPRDGWEPPRSDFVRAMECLERKCPLHYCDLVDGVLDETAFCYLECHTIPRANGSWVRISFIQSPQGTPLRGIVPNAVTKLLNLRKAVKRDMEASKIAGDKAKVRKLNAKQAALKVSANSIYGFCGSETADISCPDLACTITTLGRNYLYGVCTFIAENDPAFNTGGKTVVVYGDTGRFCCFQW